MELLITYSPSGKTKYFNVLLESGEILAARTKKAALYILQTLQEKLNVRSRESIADYPQSNADSQTTIGENSDADQDDNSVSDVREFDSCEATRRLSRTRQKYPEAFLPKGEPNSLSRRVDGFNERLARDIKIVEESIRVGAIEAEQHRINAEQYRLDAEQTAREIKQHERDIEDIQQLRDEWSSLLHGDSANFGGSKQNQVPQQFDDERPMRQIFQPDS